MFATGCAAPLAIEQRVNAVRLSPRFSRQTVGTGLAASEEPVDKEDTIIAVHTAFVQLQIAICSVSTRFAGAGLRRWEHAMRFYTFQIGHVES